MAFFSLALAALTGCREPVFIGADGGAGGAGGAGTSGSSGDAGSGGATSGAGGGATTSTTDGALFEDPPEGSFPCGPQGYCMKDTHYCLLSVDGPCCGATYTCVPLPAPCQETGAACSCFDGQPCPCGDAPNACSDPLVSVECSFDDPSGAFSLSCLHP